MTGRRGLTETELVLSTLTNEELEDAARFMGHMHDRWKQSRAIAEREGRDALLQIGYHGTDGPIHGLRALDLAIVRERAVRGGADPWEATQSTEGHPARATLEYYRERLELNPDQGVIPRLNAAGVLEVVCPSCSQPKPLTVAFWRWLGSQMDLFCRACRDAGERDAAQRTRAAILDHEEAQPPATAQIEPFTPEELLEEVAL